MIQMFETKIYVKDKLVFPPHDHISNSAQAGKACNAQTPLQANMSRVALIRTTLILRTHLFSRKRNRTKTSSYPKISYNIIRVIGSAPG